MDERSLHDVWRGTLSAESGAADQLDPNRTYKSPDEHRVSTLSGSQTLSTTATLSGSPTLSAAGTLSGIGTVLPNDATTALAASPTQGFDLVSELGRGGMGVVYRARQRSLDRDIAVKFIKDANQDGSIRSRFVAEALVNGALDHPNIVPVIELGQTPAGEVYLAMKLVGGRSWKDLLAEQHAAGNVDVDQHLGIIQAVGNAIGFAHAKGIVHRDLKPENVMVGAFGEVLVMDWGIAVDIRDLPEGDCRAQHKSSISAPGGTPSYMPPELAMGRGSDIGPWTDTYLLGAILYEVLGGTPPHRGHTLMAVLLAAAHSQVAPLPGIVPQGLRNICSKALRAQPTERYHSVAALQADLHDYVKHRESEKVSAAASAQLHLCQAAALARHGNAISRASSASLYADFAEAVAGFRQALLLWAGNPAAQEGQTVARAAYARAALAGGDLGLAEAQVQAMSESPEAVELRRAVNDAHQVQAHQARAARRNRGLLIGATALIVIGLAIGIVLVRAEQARTESERDRAVLAEGAAQESAELARSKAAEAERQRGIADEQRAQAEQQTKLAQTERDQAEELTSYMIFELRDGLADIGKLDLLLPIAERVQQHYAQRPDAELTGNEINRMAAGLSNLGSLQMALGQSQAALASFEKTLKMVGELHPNDVGTILHQQQNMMKCYSKIGDIRLAQGDLAAAEQAYLAVQDLNQKLVAALPDNNELIQGMAAGYLKMGELYRTQGRLAKGMEAYQQGLAILEKLRSTSPDDAELDMQAFYQGISELAQLAGDLPQATQAAQASLAINRRQVAKNPGQLRAQHDLAVSHDRLGTIYRTQGNLVASLKSYQEAHTILESLVARDPDRAAWQSDLSLSWFKMGSVQWEKKDLNAAKKSYDAGLVIAKKVAAGDPSNAQSKRFLASAYEKIGGLCLALRDIEAARSALLTGNALLNELVASDPSNPDWQRNLGINTNRLGDLYSAQGDPVAALKAFRRSLDIFVALSASDPHNAVWAGDVLASWLNLARLAHAQNQFVAERRALLSGLVVGRALAAAHPDIPKYASQVDILTRALARIDTPSNRLAALRADVAESPDNASAQQALAMELLSSSSAALRQPAEALTLAESAQRLSGGTDLAVQFTLAVAYGEAGRWDEAIASLEKATLPAAADAATREKYVTTLQRLKQHQPLPAASDP